MIPPLIRELIDELGARRQFGAIRVYLALEREYPQIYYEPQAVKIWLLAETLKTNRLRVQEGLELLIHEGFVIDCSGDGRAKNAARKLMLARSRPPRLTIDHAQCTETVQRKVTA